MIAELLLATTLFSLPLLEEPKPKPVTTALWARAFHYTGVSSDIYSTKRVLDYYPYLEEKNDLLTIFGEEQQQVVTTMVVFHSFAAWGIREAVRRKKLKRWKGNVLHVVFGGLGFYYAKRNFDLIDDTDSYYLGN